MNAPALPLITLNQAADLLAQGQMVAIPTETVYGLAADAQNPQAVAQIFATMLLVYLFSLRNFAVGTAYSKTEPVQVAASPRPAVISSASPMP